MDAPRDALERDDGIVVVECPLYGLFHFEPSTDLTEGPHASASLVNWRVWRCVECGVPILRNLR